MGPWERAIPRAAGHTKIRGYLRTGGSAKGPIDGLQTSITSQETSLFDLRQPYEEKATRTARHPKAKGDERHQKGHMELITGYEHRPQERGMYSIFSIAEHAKNRRDT